MIPFFFFNNSIKLVKVKKAWLVQKQIYIGIYFSMKTLLVSETDDRSYNLHILYNGISRRPVNSFIHIPLFVRFVLSVLVLTFYNVALSNVNVFPMKFVQ